MSIDTTIKTDETKVKSALQNGLTKAEAFVKTEESVTFSGKVLAIAVGIALVVGFLVGKA